MMYWFLGLIGIVLLGVLIKKLSGGASNKFPVLLYHKVSEEFVDDFLTVQRTALEKHFHYLEKNGYSPILLSELEAFHLHKKPLPPKPVMITFDDGYRDNYTIMYPLLKKYNMKANIFIVPAFLQKETGDHPASEFLSVPEISAMDPALVEFGLHSFDHKSFNTLSMEELAADIRATREMLTDMCVTYQEAIAFPYGAYPKKDAVKLRNFFSTLNTSKITLAFRIGNRLNPLPLKNALLVQRLDIRGGMCMNKFIRKLKKGKRIF